MTKLEKHQFVTYRAWGTGSEISAIIKCMHRDGTVTVEAQHFLNADGEITGAYLGYRYRMAQHEVQAQP